MKLRPANLMTYLFVALAVCSWAVWCASYRSLIVVRYNRVGQINSQNAVSYAITWNYGRIVLSQFNFEYGARAAADMASISVGFTTRQESLRFMKRGLHGYVDRADKDALDPACPVKLHMSFAGFGFGEGGRWSGSGVAVVVPAWAPLAVLLIVPVWRFARMCRAKLRRLRGMCAVCGYDPRGSPHRCPECGGDLVASNLTPINPQALS